eukprot:TRINITY_DN4150_c0_g1_i17.p1 TRINITY_DN4150_c0_g1~~TRINITY_DN4150_c0_g1_i17.p1  ORF type:complete len:194 (-),score=2.09 TRINITY_DN4150_c0_g1_i17:329-910(-)
MLTTKSTQKYTQQLIKKLKPHPELDIILISMLFNFQIQFYYIKDFLLLNKTFDFPAKSSGEKKLLRLYMNSNGTFDTVYEKAFIRDAGICQSILLDVRLSSILRSLKVCVATRRSRTCPCIRIWSIRHGRERMREQRISLKTALISHLNRRRQKRVSMGRLQGCGEMLQSQTLQRRNFWKKSGISSLPPKLLL